MYSFLFSLNFKEPFPKDLLEELEEKEFSKREFELYLFLFLGDIKLALTVGT